MRCSATAPLLLRYCSATAPLLFRYCSATVPLLLRYCSATAPLLLRYCSATAPLLLRYCSATAPLLRSCFNADPLQLLRTVGLCEVLAVLAAGPSGSLDVDCQLPGIQGVLDTIVQG
jgi:hypothetical protein